MGDYMKCAFCGSPCHPLEGDYEAPLAKNSERKAWMHPLCHSQYLQDRWSDEIDRRLDNTPATG